MRLGNVNNSSSSHPLQRSNRIPPNDLVILRGLPLSTDEQIVHQAITNTSISVEYVRMVRDKLSGTFVVRFKSVDDATSFLERHYKSPLVIDGSLFLADYGIDKRDDDWKCLSCSASNFSWRLACHLCQRPKESSEIVDEPLKGSNDICPSPTKFLLLLGLPISADAQHIYDSLVTNNSKPLRVWLVAEGDTGASLGFAFAEYSTVIDAAGALEYLRRIDYKYKDKEDKLVPCKLSFGRDLFVLNKLYLPGKKAELEYWDPQCRLIPFPVDTVAQIASKLTTNDPPEFDKPKPRIVGSSSHRMAPVASKKIKINLQRWNKEVSDEPQLTPPPIFADYVMNSCRLCQIDFESADLLDQHINQDTEHQQALARFIQTDQSIVINRAAERREKFGSEEMPEFIESEQTAPIDWSISQEEAPESSIDTLTNKGAQILRKMGWKEGEGLGASQTGITEPIRVRKRTKGRGLGHQHE